MANFETFYKKNIWLNPEDSPSTASVVFYDGKETDDDGKEYDSKYVKISDCYHIARLHQAYYDTTEDYIAKLKLLRDELNLYIEHLQNKLKNNE